MRITVKLYATLRQYRPNAPRSGLALDLPAGTTIEALLPQLGLPDGVALVAMVNDKVEGLEHVLVDADALSLFPPVAGG
jgi:molybdopterin converting factor small subunit